MMTLWSVAAAHTPMPPDTIAAAGNVMGRLVSVEVVFMAAGSTSVDSLAASRIGSPSGQVATERGVTSEGG